jgi:hypothetical protein
MNTFYAQYTFSASLILFDKIKQKQCYDYISELAYSAKQELTKSNKRKYLLILDDVK